MRPQARVIIRDEPGLVGIGAALRLEDQLPSPGRRGHDHRAVADLDKGRPALAHQRAHKGCRIVARRVFLRERLQRHGQRGEGEEVGQVSLVDQAARVAQPVAGHGQEGLGRNPRARCRLGRRACTVTDTGGEHIAPR